MTQAQLDRAVARATGESVTTIQSRGFSPMANPPRPRRRRRWQFWRYRRQNPITPKCTLQIA